MLGSNDSLPIIVPSSVRILASNTSLLSNIGEIDFL